jgi:hypothetical protein
MSDEELSLEFIDEILSERDTALGKPTYQIPQQTSEYVRTVAKEGRCVFLQCEAPTYFQIKEQYYCTVHAIHYMGNLLDEKINHYSGLTPYLEQTMKAYERMEQHPHADFEEMWLNVKAEHIVIEHTDHQNLKITVDGKQFNKSPYVDIEGILILSFLQMLR